MQVIYIQFSKKLGNLCILSAIYFKMCIICFWGRMKSPVRTAMSSANPKQYILMLVLTS